MNEYKEDFKKVKELKDCNMHIDNGGIGIEIQNHVTEYNSYDGELIHEETPILNINASHFGIQTNDIKIPVDSERLKKLGEWLIESSEQVKTWEKFSDLMIEFRIQ